MSYFRKKSLFSFIQLSFANFATKFISIPLLVFYTRYLSKDELSFIPIYIMLGSMSTLFFNFGILPTFVKLIPSTLERSREETREIIITGFTVNLVGVLIFCFSTFTFSVNVSTFVFHNPLYSDILKIMSVGFFFQGVYTVSNYLLWATSRFSKTTIITVVKPCAQALLTVILYLKYGLNGLVIGLILTDLILTVMAVYFLRDFLFHVPQRFCSIKKVTSFSFYMEGYLMYIRSQGDQWIIATFLEPSALAIYYLARRIYEMLNMIFESFDKVVTSSLAKIRNDKKILSEKISQLFSLIAYSVFPSTFVVIGLTPFLIDLIAGEAYKTAVVPAIILNLLVIVTFFWGPTIGRSVFILNPSIDRVKITAVESVILLFFLVVLSHWFNIVGVAFARLFSSIATGIYAYSVIRRSFQIKMPQKEIFIVFISSVCMSIFLLAGQLIYFNYFMISIYLIGGIMVFLLLINFYLSEQYYSTLNLILPFTLKDPIKLFLSKVTAKRCEY